MLHQFWKNLDSIWNNVDATFVSTSFQLCVESDLYYCWWIMHFSLLQKGISSVCGLCWFVDGSLQRVWNWNSCRIVCNWFKKWQYLLRHFFIICKLLIVINDDCVLYEMTSLVVKSSLYNLPCCVCIVFSLTISGFL